MFQVWRYVEAVVGSLSNQDIKGNEEFGISIRQWTVY